MRALLVAAILLTAGLVGCLGGDGEGGADDLQAQAEATENTGGIQGVVTDPAIQPVQGATVSLDGIGEHTQTASDGSFAFSNLAPGEYRLQVEAETYVSTEKPVQVSSGQISTVDVILAHKVGLEPYSQQIELNGFVECSVRVLIGFAACAVPNAVLGNTTNDRFLLPFSLEPNPYQMVTEVEWEATQPLGTRLSISVEPNGLPNDNKTEFGSAVGESPLRVTTDRQRFLEVDKNTTAVCEGEKDPQSSISAGRDSYCNRNYVEEGGEAYIRMFVAHAAEPATVPEQVPCVEGICAGGAGIGAGLAVQQGYHAVATIFYHAPACQGYSLFEDNECPQEETPRNISSVNPSNGTGNGSGHGSDGGPRALTPQDPTPSHAREAPDQDPWAPLLGLWGR